MCCSVPLTARHHADSFTTPTLRVYRPYHEEAHHRFGLFTATWLETTHRNPTTSHSAINNRAVVADTHPPSMEEIETSAPPAYDIPETANQPEDPDTTEYVIDKLLSQSDTFEGRFCKVRWYSYGPQADEWLPKRDIPENIVALYWRSVRRKTARTRPPLERGEDNRETRLMQILETTTVFYTTTNT